MAIWIFEDTIGGGRFQQPEAPLAPESLRREGRAMVASLIESFSPGLRRQLRVAWDVAAGEVPINVPLDWIDSRAALDRWFELACVRSRADDDPCSALLIIAPESENCLLHWAQRAIQLGARLASPDPEFIALASDKTQTRTWLEAQGVPVPRHRPADGEATRSWIIKPRDGCGSQSVQVETCPVSETPSQQRWPRERWQVEPYQPGVAVSVACLRSRCGFQLLPPMLQNIAIDHGFEYRGGEFPLTPSLAARATRLARQTVQSLPVTQGYFGMDLVLGASSDQDSVIEINPRLTTSYVALRHCVQPWLGDAMIATARDPAASARPGDDQTVLMRPMNGEALRVDLTELKFTAAGEVVFGTRVAESV